METFSNFSPECLIFSVLSSVQSLHWYDWKHWYNPVLVSSTQVHHAVKCNKLKKRFERSQRSRHNIKARGAPTAVTSLLVCVAVLDGDNGEHEQDQISVGTIITFILIILLISVDLYRWWRRPKIVIDTFSLVTDVSTIFYCWWNPLTFSVSIWTRGLCFFVLSWLMLLTHFIFYKGKTFQEVALFSLYWTKSMCTSRSVWSHFCLFIIDVFSSHCCVDYSWITPCTTKHTQVISASSKAYKNIVSMQGAC